MQIAVTFRNISSSESIKNYAEKKIKRLERFLKTSNLEANLVVAVEKFRHISELSLWVNGEKLYGKEEAEDIYAAIDTVVDKIERQISKLKDKRPRKIAESVLTTTEESSADMPRIIKTDRFHPKPMDVEEALNQLQISAQDFLVFLNTETNAICVLHKMKDGNYELIEPTI
ncbi:MAG: ribosome-associated translation inhibitor RaiA [Thermodesulfobacteriota bacterium]|nr:MAG: ribosome-associated translation inhibitor RaiA [Thermodesulfobacteriota bacterium]